MKKTIMILLVFVTVTAHAQSYEKGQVDFNIGMGLGNTFINRSSYVVPGSNFHSIPVINVSGEYAITDDIGVGGFIGFSTAKWSYTNYYSKYNPSTGWVDYPYTDTWKFSYFIVGARGAYHFAKLIPVDKLDVYAGLMLGYDIATAKWSSTDPNHGVGYAVGSVGGFAYSIFGGARYRFTDQIGVFGELGYGISVLNIGLNIKL